MVAEERGGEKKGGRCRPSWRHSLNRPRKDDPVPSLYIRDTEEKRKRGKFGIVECYRDASPNPAIVIGGEGKRFGCSSLVRGREGGRKKALACSMMDKGVYFFRSQPGRKISSKPRRERGEREGAQAVMPVWGIPTPLSRSPGGAAIPLLIFIKEEKKGGGREWKGAWNLILRKRGFPSLRWEKERGKKRGGRGNPLSESDGVGFIAQRMVE